jgi:hypothetical protein
MSSSTSGGDESDWKAVQSKKEKKKFMQKGKKDYKTPSPPRVSKSGRRIKNASNDEMALCTVQECFNEAAGSNSKCVACDRYYYHSLFMFFFSMIAIEVPYSSFKLNNYSS